MAYKKDQGRLVRMAAYWSLALLILYGCKSLYALLPTWAEALGKPLSASMPKIPILGWLFQRREFTEESRELLIFITPRIIKS